MLREYHPFHEPWIVSFLLLISSSHQKQKWNFDGTFSSITCTCKCISLCKIPPGSSASQKSQQFWAILGYLSEFRARLGLSRVLTSQCFLPVPRISDHSHRSGQRVPSISDASYNLHPAGAIFTGAQSSHHQYPQYFVHAPSSSSNSSGAFAIQGATGGYHLEPQTPPVTVGGEFCYLAKTAIFFVEDISRLSRGSMGWNCMKSTRFMWRRMVFLVHKRDRIELRIRIWLPVYDRLWREIFKTFLSPTDRQTDATMEEKKSRACDEKSVFWDRPQ